MATIEELPDDCVDLKDAPQSAEHPAEESGGNSEQGEGGNTNSSLNQSMDHSVHNSDLGNEDSNAPLSSRGSTKATGEEDSMSLRSAGTDNVNRDYIESRGYRHTHHYYGQEEEDQRDTDGSPMMTNRFFWELFKKEWKKYYRTPSLNEKLYLHYKGFSYIRNMEQFTGLKCLYFEGNGAKSMKGLEHCVDMRSLFMQENMITKIEGLETMKELRQLNLSENMLQKIEGLENNVELDTIHLKRNRLGRWEGGDIEALKGLLDRPTISCLDIQDNYLENPDILPEILMKMPSLKVLYLLNNPCIKKITGYRKTVIASIPQLTYLDDRPVFEDDRRRAEAWVRGGIEEERVEIKKIKKEKDDKHWANHEAFRVMVNKAREEKMTKEQEDKAAKDYKKQSMKEMMAAAKIAKEQGRGAEIGQFGVKSINAANGEYSWEPNDLQQQTDFYNGVKDKAEQRLQEKQDGVEHEDELGADFHLNNAEVTKEAGQKFEDRMDKEMDNEFKGFKSTVKDKDTADQLQKEYDQNKLNHEKNKGGMQIEEVTEVIGEVQDEEAPDLEEVDLNDLERTKAQKNKEWLNKIVVEQQNSKKAQESKAKEEEAQVDDQDSQKSEVDLDEIKLDEKKLEELEEILTDEKKCTDLQNKITKKEIEETIEAQVEAVQGSKQIHAGTDFDELD